MRPVMLRLQPLIGVCICPCAGGAPWQAAAGTHKTLDVLGQLPRGCDWQRISGLLDHGRIPEAYQALQCTVSDTPASLGRTTAKLFYPLHSAIEAPVQHGAAIAAVAAAGMLQCCLDDAMLCPGAATRGSNGRHCSEVHFRSGC